MAPTEEIWKLDALPPVFTENHTLGSSCLRALAALQNDENTRRNINEAACHYEEIVSTADMTFDDVLMQSRDRSGYAFRHRALLEDHMLKVTSAVKKSKLFALCEGIQRGTAIFIQLPSMLSIEHVPVSNRKKWELNVRNFIEQLTSYEKIAVKTYVRLMGRRLSGNLAEDVVACGALPAKMRHLPSLLSSLPGAPDQEKPTTDEQKREIHWILSGGLGSWFVPFAYDNFPDLDAEKILETLGSAIWEWMALKRYENQNFNYKETIWRFFQGCLEAALKKYYQGTSLSDKAPETAYEYVSNYFMAYRKASASGEGPDIWYLSKQANQHGEALGQLRDDIDDLKEQNKRIEEQNGRIEEQNGKISKDVEALTKNIEGLTTLVQALISKNEK